MKEKKIDYFLPYGRQKITDEDIEEVTKVLRSPFLTQGPTVPLFEKAVAAKIKASETIAVNSATSGLHLSCLALGLSKEDYLWTSPITFVASANCALYCGANIDFVDINPIDGLISTELLRKKLEKAKKFNKLPKIVVVVHLTGSSCDMETIYNLSIKYGFKIIEDASHAIGGKYKNIPVGSCKYSEICVFSFHPVKIITTGEGGIISTNNSKIAKLIRSLRNHGITKDKNDFQYIPKGSWSYEQQSLGFNYRMTDIQAALGLSQLKRLENIIEKRNKILDIYKNLLEGMPLKFLEIPKNVISSVHLCVIRLENQDKEFHKKVFESMKSANIGVQLHYLPVHLHPYYQNLGFSEGDYPNSESYANNAISLPLFVDIKFEEQQYVVETLKRLIT